MYLYKKFANNVKANCTNDFNDYNTKGNRFGIPVNICPRKVVLI